MERESFVFYRSFRDAFRALDKDVRLRMYEAIIDYGLDLIEPHFEGIEKVLWTLIRPQLEANNKRFENGCKGGAPIGNQNARKQPRNNRKQPRNNRETTKNNLM